MADPEPSCRYPRLSLFSMLMLTALAACGITIAMLWQEVGPLRAEVSRLRLEAGQLEVNDPKLVHAIGVDTYQYHAWMFRVWAPAGRKTVVRLAHRDIPGSGLPAKSSSLEINRGNLEGAEVEVKIAIEKRLDGTLRWNFGIPSMTRHISMPEEASEWLTDGSSGWTGGRYLDRQLVEKLGEPLVLLRQRHYYDRGAIPPDPRPELTDGVMVWIEVEDPAEPVPDSPPGG